MFAGHDKSHSSILYGKGSRSLKIVKFTDVFILDVHCKELDGEMNSYKTKPCRTQGGSQESDTSFGH